jgi:hypothetical protein
MIFEWLEAGERCTMGDVCHRWLQAVQLCEEWQEREKVRRGEGRMPLAAPGPPASSSCAAAAALPRAPGSGGGTCGGGDVLAPADGPRVAGARPPARTAASPGAAVSRPLFWLDRRGEDAGEEVQQGSRAADAVPC